jgi:hypothetical protein
LKARSTFRAGQTKLRPTPEMVDAGLRELMDSPLVDDPREVDRVSVARIWRAMHLTSCLRSLHQSAHKERSRLLRRFWTAGLAYAITVHKSQGSEFQKVFVVLPKNCRTLSRELLYTHTVAALACSACRGRQRGGGVVARHTRDMSLPRRRMLGAMARLLQAWSRPAFWTGHISRRTMPDS